MNKITLLYILLFFTVTSSFTQDTALELAEYYLDTKGEVCFNFYAQSEAQVKELHSFLSYGHKPISKKDLIVEAYAHEDTFKKFLEYGIPYSVDPKDNDVPQLNDPTKDIQAWDTTWDAYPTYTQYVNKMNYYASTFPNLCTLENIGTTYNGRSLLVLKISDNVATDEAEPEFFYSSSMHGDELAGYPLMIRFIDYLLNNYGTDTEVTNLVNDTEIFIAPLANPDGTYRAAGNDVITNPIRANARNKDLNRNYPDNQEIGRVNGNSGNTSRLHYDHSNNEYEIETASFMKFEESRNIVLGANFHGGVELVNYPYDNIDQSQLHPDHDYYERISVEYANHCQTNSPGDPTYMTVDYDSGAPWGPSPGVTHGSTWYTVYGGRQDYMNYFRHSKELTIELSDTKWIPGNQLPNLWDYNRQAFLDLLKQVNYGLHGTVTDESGNAVKAKVFIAGHDALNSWVSSHETLGDYHRLLEGGNYNVTYEAPGYVSQTIPVTITNQARTVQDVVLVAETANPTAPGTSICDGETANLTATGTGGTYNWYNNINDDTPVFTGANFTTPVLNSTTSYYVEEVIARPNVGETGNTTNGGFFQGGEPDRYLIFSSTEPVMLKSVEINVGVTGEIEVQLQDSAGNMLDSRVLIIENTGIQEIDLDFFVPVGTDMRLASAEMSTGMTLFRNNAIAGTNYPYTNGPITITNSNVSTQYYYFFYDWKIEPIRSAREQVTVTVNPNPVANFSHVVNPANNGEVTFTNTSLDADTYSWDFGDGVGTSTATDPVYTYLASGTYNVALTSGNPNCPDDQIIIPVDVTVETLSIADNDISNLKIYPNPFEGRIDIQIPTGFNPNDMNAELFDIQGRLISNDFNMSQNKLIINNLSNIAIGTYLLKVTDLRSGASISKHLVKR